jgi:hypothetical protein
MTKEGRAMGLMAEFWRQVDASYDRCFRAAYSGPDETGAARTAEAAARVAVQRYAAADWRATRDLARVAAWCHPAWGPWRVLLTALWKAHCAQPADTAPLRRS